MTDTLRCVILFTVIIVTGIVLTILGKRRERKNFNNGTCLHCGAQLTCFDHDSQGGRGYYCRNCNYVTWVSYKSVDKDFREQDWEPLPKPNTLYISLRPHIGHTIVCVCYGKADEDPRNISIECEDCNEVLVSAEMYEEDTYGKW